ncbi:MAG: hypothetical protein CK425_05470 [Parachlamydia sp.]|nr:MAG: hypothetical protein CK425_05470 [Parachlamydia sp.]
MLGDIRKLSQIGEGEVWMTDHGKVYCSDSSKTSPDFQEVLTDLAKIVKRDSNASILDLSTLKDKEIKQVENYSFAHPNAEHVIQKILHVESANPGVMEAHDQFLNTTYDKLEEKLFTDFGLNLNLAINPEQFPDLFTQVQHKRRLIDDTIKVLTDARVNTEDCQNVDTMLASLGSEEQIQQWLEHMHQQGYPGATVILGYRTNDLNEKLGRYASAAEKGNFEALRQLVFWEKDPIQRMGQLSHLIDSDHAEAIRSSPQLKYEASYALFDKASNYEAEEYEEIVAKGYALMREAAEEGNVWAKIDLALTEEDPEKKIERLSELNAQGFTEAHDSLADAKQELANTLFSSTSYLSKKEKESIRARASQLLQEAADMGNEKAIISLASHLIHGSHGYSINRESAREILEKILASSNSELIGKAHLLIAESYQGTENSSDKVLSHLAAAISLGAEGSHPEYIRNGPKEVAELYAFLKFSETYPELDLTTFIDEKLTTQSKNDYIHAIQQIFQGERQLQMQGVIHGKPIELFPVILEKITHHLLKTKAINNDHNKYFDPRRVDIIGAKGIEIILNDINEKKHYFDEMPCSICEGLNKIQETVTKVITDLRVSPNAGKRGVVIIGETGHALPLYIEKNQNGRLKIINTDTAQIIYGTKIYEPIVASLREMHIQPTEIEIIGDSDASRQHDETSCPIFAIRDLVQFARTHETVQFFDEQEKTLESFEWMGEYKYTIVKDYPPALMNTTQSLNSLERYDLQMGLASKNEDLEVEYSRESVTEKLSQAGKIAYIGKNRSNAKILFLIHKYQELILIKALENL